MRMSHVMGVAISLIAWTASSWAQGFVIAPPERHIPVPPTPNLHPANLREHQVNIDIQDQVARVQVSQRFHNPGSRPIEVEYFFPLPEEGVIDQFSLTVDGKEIAGRILSKEEARRIYEDIVRRRKDPALLEYMGRGVFRTSVFPVPPGRDCVVALNYTQVLPLEGNRLAFNYPVGRSSLSGQPPARFKIAGRIRHTRLVKSIYSPSHSVQINRPSDHEATFDFEHAQASGGGDFRLLFSVGGEDVGLSLLSYRPDPTQAGYFMVLASPKVAVPATAVLPKTVVFVLDKSGSMTGKKIDQAKASLRFVLRNLAAQDTFNIVTYDGAITTFKTELQRCDGDTIAQALQFVDRISAGGSTNIDGALRTAMDMLTVEGRPTYVVFLTDGLPTAGEKRLPAIAQNCKRANKVRARLMAFGVGDDVNARLLDKLIVENYGASHYVRPSEDIEEPVSKLFARMSAPVLSDVKLSFAGLDTTLTYPHVLPDVFRGSQLIVVGRYHQSGTVTVTLSGRSGAAQQSFSHHVALDDRQAPYAHAFIEKVWAERRVGYLIDEIDLNGPNTELTREIVSLSTRHGILTPYTSFLADERIDLADMDGNSARAQDSLSFLSIESGREAVAMRARKGSRKKEQMAPAPGAAMAYSLSGEARQVNTVYQLGSKTFFKRGQRWQDSVVTAEQEQFARRIARFSEEYFELVRSLPASDNQYLTLDGEIFLRVGGDTVLIVP